jgi:hypothetical protein
VNPCVGVHCTWIPDGDCPGNLSLGRHTGDGKSDGETFLGRTWMFFLGWARGEEKAPGYGQQGRSLDGTRFQTSPFCYILYISQWKFRCSIMRQTIANGGPDPRCPGQTGALFGFRQVVNLVHTLKTMEGLFLLVPSRTPRSSGYDVYAYAVYVVICYMSITCMSVICCHMLYVSYMLYVCYMSSSRDLLLYVEVNRRPMYEYRCDERLQVKVRVSTRLRWEHLKIQTMLNPIDEGLLL